MRSVFVAGTDTGVGKTVVAGALARTAAVAGCRTGILKPFVSGGMDDLAVLGSALADAPARGGGGGAREQGAAAAQHVYAFDEPASPYTAARTEGKAIDIGRVLDKFAQMRREYEAVVVEGIGGAMTPILDGYFAADLARDMGVSSVIVTSNGFDAGGLSAMAASLCRQRGAHVSGFVVNRIEKYGYRAGVLRDEIAATTGLPVLATIRRPAAGAGRSRTRSTWPP